MGEVTNRSTTTTSNLTYHHRMTTSTQRSTRATTKFKYQSKRETGSPKTLVTVRLDDDLLDALAREGNKAGLSMSATVRRVIRRGLGVDDAPVGKRAVRTKRRVTTNTAAKATNGKSANSNGKAAPSNVTSIKSRSKNGRVDRGVLAKDPPG